MEQRDTCYNFILCFFKTTHIIQLKNLLSHPKDWLLKIYFLLKCTLTVPLLVKQEHHKNFDKSLWNIHFTDNKSCFQKFVYAEMTNIVINLYSPLYIKYYSQALIWTRPFNQSSTRVLLCSYKNALLLHVNNLSYPTNTT